MPEDRELSFSTSPVGGGTLVPVHPPLPTANNYRVPIMCQRLCKELGMGWRWLEVASETTTGALCNQGFRLIIVSQPLLFLVSCFRFPQKQTLRQRFECEWFTWAVTTGNTGRGSGAMKQRREGTNTGGVVQPRPSWHLELSLAREPSAETAQNRIVPTKERGSWNTDPPTSIPSWARAVPGA